MNLNKKYVVGCHVMWYEIEMLPEYVASCVQMLEGIKNPENVIFDFVLNFQYDYEKPDIKQIIKRFDLFKNTKGYIDWQILYKNKFEEIIEQIPVPKGNIRIEWIHDQNTVSFYNIADYRRALNDYWCTRVDYVLWGECDSMWSKQTLQIIEQIPNNPPKHIITFAYRKNWDKSWDIVTHPIFVNTEYKEEDVLSAEWSEKSYMTLDRMNEINDVTNIEFRCFDRPKFDGSCLVISSELIKSGINIPRSLLLAGEDTSFMEMCGRVLDDQYLQYHVSNILRVHNRRHPNKRVGILNENNPQGFCDERKGEWWIELEEKSKFNLNNLFTNFTKFKTI